MLESHRRSHSRRFGGIALACLVVAVSSVTAGELAPSADSAAELTEPRPIVRVNPLYPRKAAFEEIEGQVRLEFLITETGEVDEIVILESEPEGVFDTVAIDAIANWRFEPALADGRPTARRAEQVLDFRLD